MLELDVERAHGGRAAGAPLREADAGGDAERRHVEPAVGGVLDVDLEAGLAARTAGALAAAAPQEVRVRPDRQRLEARIARRLEAQRIAVLVGQRGVEVDDARGVVHRVRRVLLAAGEREDEKRSHRLCATGIFHVVWTAPAVTAISTTARLCSAFHAALLSNSIGTHA